MAGWGGRDEAVDDFDEYDPTPYGGGYDLGLTYGRPLPPSEEICYPISSSNVDYDRTHYSSGSVPSAYGASDEGYGEAQYGHSRPKPQPAYDFRPQQEVDEGGVGDYGGGRRPQPGPGYGRPGGVGYGGSDEYRSDYGSGRPKRDEHPSYGQEDGSGYGGGGYGYGHDQGPKTYREEEGGQGYGYGSKYRGGGEYGSGGGNQYQSGGYGYGAKPSYEKPVYGTEEETGGFNRPTRYGADQGEGYGRPSYGSPAYDPGQGEGYGRPSYGNEYEAEDKHHHHKHHHHRYADDE
ncbi:hypothetical protein Cni_G13861 [Canna indica]|uniref:Uncharacterized protein n=1 Tax=Canna indica TaxID=4628 RepID=A0AAQ3KDE8_9LILI|nr:hypothetical protein Cni_G13861 [Canna indica]